MSPQKRRTCCGRRAATAAALLLSASQRLSQSLVQIKIAPTTRTSLRAEGTRPQGRDESSLTSALGAAELWMPSGPSSDLPGPEKRKEEAFTAKAVLECAKSGDGRRAARWLEVLLSRGLLEEESSSVIFCAVAPALARQGFAVAASRYLQRCMDMGQTPEAEIFRRVLLELEQGGATDDADDFVLLHEQMRLAGHLPDLDCCKAVLRRLGGANNSLDAAVRWVEHEMPSCGVEPDDEAFEILFNACRREGRTQRARGWLERMRSPPSQRLLLKLQEELQSEEVDALELWLSEPVLEELQRCRPLARRLLSRLSATSPQQAEEWLDRLLSAGLEPDRMCYSCIAEAWLETGDLSRSAAMVDRMVAAGFLPSREMTAAVLLAGYDDEKQDASESKADARVADLAQTGRIHEAAQILLEELAASRAVEAPSFEKLIAAFGAKGYPEEATEWFHRMAACGLKQGVKASSALVTAWAVSGNPAKAAEVLKELEDQGKDLDQYAYTSVISAFADEANATAAEDWFNDMAQRGFDADVAASNAVLKAIVQKNLSAAESWLEAMPQQQLAPTAVSYNTLLGGLAQVGRAEEIRTWMERMRAARCLPGIVTYNAVIKGFTKLRMLPQAEEWLRQLQGVRLNPDATTYNQLIRGCAPDIQGASGWFEEMQLQKLEPDAVSYNSIIHCCGELFAPSADKGDHDAPQERCKRLRRLPWGMAEAFFPQSGFLAPLWLLPACPSRGDGTKPFLDARWLRHAAMSFTHLYDMPASSEDVLLWRKSCDGSDCEYYSVGNGYCLMRTSDHQEMQRLQLIEQEEVARLQKSGIRLDPNSDSGHAPDPPVWLIPSNCRVRSLGPMPPQIWIDRQNRTLPSDAWPVEVQLSHCPKRVPVAILTIPKCGTTSTINWALQMEGEEDLDSLVQGASLFLKYKGPGEFSDSFIIPELQRAAAAGAIPTEKLAGSAWSSNMMYRAIHRYKPGGENYDKSMAVEREFVPPAHLCPFCCLYGHGRQHVVMGRNPFVRMTSYFKFSWLNNNAVWGEHKWTRWEGFGDWLSLVMEARGSMPGGFANGLQWAPTIRQSCRQSSTLIPGTALHPFHCETKYYSLSAEDIFHIRPLSDMVHDERFLAGSSFLEDVVVLHLETLQDDIELLRDTLCRRFSFCAGLPPFPQVLPGKNLRDSMREGAVKEHCSFKEKTLEWRNCTAPAWTQLWTEHLRQQMIWHYGDDFKWLGYSTDPGHLMPLSAAQPKLAHRWLRAMERRGLELRPRTHRGRGLHQVKNAMMLCICLDVFD
ncbi:unnamed protein product [Symbiodinium microadriaticum]|nr:unnamed protein product [Symbiodinium microadriaticum]CAE7948220.1 unnamed protein product [Symbiodinium sp. KB8]